MPRAGAALRQRHPFGRMPGPSLAWAPTPHRADLPAPWATHPAGAPPDLARRAPTPFRRAGPFPRPIYRTGGHSAPTFSPGVPLPAHVHGRQGLPSFPPTGAPDRAPRASFRARNEIISHRYFYIVLFIDRAECPIIPFIPNAGAHRAPAGGRGRPPTALGYRELGQGLGRASDRTSGPMDPTRPPAAAGSQGQARTWRQDRRRASWNRETVTRSMPLSKIPDGRTSGRKPRQPRRAH